MSPLQEITEDEARERLRALDPKAIKAARLAREWGWSRWKVRQLIAACRAEGVIPPIPAGSEPKRKTAPIDAPDPSPAIDVRSRPAGKHAGRGRYPHEQNRRSPPG